MELYLKDKVILLSSGDPDICNSIARLLLDEGAIPIIIDGNIKALSVEKEHDDFLYSTVPRIPAHLDNADEVENAIAKAVSQFGHIDGVVNIPSKYQPLAEVETDYFLEALHTSLLEYYIITQKALPALKLSKGSIVNISDSTSAVVQETDTLCASANGAREALTREWAVELLKYSIRVNSIVLTTSIQKFRGQDMKISNDDNIANAVVFLLSGQSSHTTGQLIQLER